MAHSHHTKAAAQWVSGHNLSVVALYIWQNACWSGYAKTEQVQAYLLVTLTYTDALYSFWVTCW